MKVVPDESNDFGFRIEALNALPVTWSAADDYSMHRDGFVFPDSDSRLLSDEDVYTLDSLAPDELKEMLGFARNEIFARHGNIFDTPTYRDFFSQFAWYAPTHKVDGSELNSYETANVRLILDQEEWLDEWLREMY